MVYFLIEKTGLESVDLMEITLLMRQMSLAEM